MLSGVASASFTGLLDEYPSAAAAYSVRRLSSTYEGALIRVREDSGDTEADIGFDANSNLDTAALLAHCGVNSGFVVTWYDQSGNGNNATQTSASLQSQIIASGVITLVNTKPSTDFDGSDYYNLTSPITPVTTFDVTKIDTSGTVNYLTWSTSGNKGYYLYGGAIGNNVGVFDGGVKSAFANDLNQHLNYYYYNGSNFQISQDNGVETALTAGSNFSINMLGRNATNFSLNGKSQELIIYASDMSANKEGIQTNINTYYSIYSPSSGIGTWAIGTTFVIQ